MISIDNANIDFELIIQKQKDNLYKVTTPLFPTCKGIGETRDDGIKKLCKSISSFIRKMTNQYLESHLLRQDYSEVVTDINQSDSFQHRVVHIPHKLNSSKRRVYLKQLDSLINSDGVSYDSFKSSELSIDYNKNNRANNDDTILGINVCLN